MKSNVFMFSIAQNGYELLWNKCIQSHKQYAEQNSYDYVLFNHPRWVTSAKESAWLKIPLLLEALRKDYDWVFYIDADCEIRLKAPKIEQIEVSNKSLYFVCGHSGRINSGVMIVKNTNDAKSFFEKVLDSAEVDVPQEDRTAYENGHIMYFAKSCKQVQILESKWNNTEDPMLDDYVRHYTGPLRPFYIRSTLDKVKVKIVRLQVKAFQKTIKLFGFYTTTQLSLKKRLELLTEVNKVQFPSNSAIASKF